MTQSLFHAQTFTDNQKFSLTTKVVHTTAAAALLAKLAARLDFSTCTMLKTRVE